MDRKIFLDGIEALGGKVSDIQITQFEKYSRLLVEWNEKMNLTAVTDDEGIAVKHFLDSILPLYYIDFEEIKSIADVGTGAGFPGLPIKIMRPDISLTLIDSLNKRINFLNQVTDALELNDVTSIHARAEDAGHKKELRQKFDAVVSRAVANMTMLSEYCLPFVKKGGLFIALKSENSEEELKDAKAMIGNLGGEVRDVISAKLPMSDIIRTFIVIEKVKERPKNFPRRADKIKKAMKKAPNV